VAKGETAIKAQRHRERERERERERVIYVCIYVFTNVGCIIKDARRMGAHLGEVGGV
jgi:hypothetical protein